MKNLIIAFILFSLLLANGGFFTEGAGGSGTVSNNNKSKDISIQKEVLKIDLKEKEAIVNVDYIFENESEKEVTVKLAFPAVLVRSGWEDAAYTDIKDYKIYDENNLLKYINVTGNKVEFAEQYAVNLYNDASSFRYTDAVYLWKISEISFKPKEKKNIKVLYTSPYFIGELNISGIPETVTPKMFKYLLHTGNSWKGSIKNCYIEVSSSSFDISKLAAYPKGHTKKGNKLVWTYKNFNPEIKDNIEVLVSTPKEGFMRGERWDQSNIVQFEYSDFFRIIPKNEYEIIAKDTNPKYPTKYMQDGNFDTAWVASNKTKTTFEVTFKKPINLTKIGILPGYFKTEAIYKANNKIKKIEIDYLNGNKQLMEYDEVGFNTFFSLVNDYYWHEVFIREKYEREQMVSKIKITIEEVYKGSKYNDTCIGEIRFIERTKERDPSLRRAG